MTSDKIELLVQPVGYDNDNFNKFDYYHSIGNWEMAEQLYEEIKQQNLELKEKIKTVIDLLQEENS